MFRKSPILFFIIPLAGIIACTNPTGGESENKITNAEAIEFLESIRAEAEAGESGKTYTLERDVDLGAMDWVPIGTDNKPFKGVFDGNGYTIKGLKLPDDVKHSGLFGYVSGSGTGIKNLNIELDTPQLSPGSTFYVGAAAGYLTDGAIINNVKVSGNLDIISSPTLRVGGITGTMADGTTITGSAFTGNISASGSNYTGGIAGMVLISASKEDLTNTISGCYTTGTISGGNYTGGITGVIQNENYTKRSENIISACYSTSAVSGGGHIGGIAGALVNFSSKDQCKSTITGCYSTGAISGSSAAIGGIAGSANNSGSTDQCQLIISGCYSTGTISGSGTVGGIIGEFSNTGSGCVIKLENSVFLGSRISSSASSIGRIAGDFGGTPTLTNNYANKAALVNESTIEDSGNKGLTHKNGEDISGALPVQSFYESLTWSFSGSNAVWKMGNTGYPMHTWETGTTPAGWKNNN
ncbi:hypothetical protein [Breznakiella homolactica]|uniref:GLUG domain-containing protein n=1 Tax=Breznakiella homolactica TaxID=2798577 RepID=A0A7T7XPM5_9SPIR|nr:hypothetical protein [Breznakiella homolactica]QQO10195.1 hypothetical protein JFL75_04540 [Breznakiella homolactica]